MHGLPPHNQPFEADFQLGDFRGLSGTLLQGHARLGSLKHHG